MVHLQKKTLFSPFPTFALNSILECLRAFQRPNPKESLSQLQTDAVRNSHELCGLKQHKHIVLELWKSDKQKIPYKTKINMWQDWLFLNSPRENIFCFNLFPCVGVADHLGRLLVALLLSFSQGLSFCLDSSSISLIIPLWLYQSHRDNAG